MKVLYFSAPTWMFLTPEQMYGEEGKLRSAHRHYLAADTYFLCKMKKIRFRAEDTCVTRDGQIQVAINVGAPKNVEIRRFVFPAFEPLFSMAHIKQIYGTREHFFEYALANLFSPERPFSRTLHRVGLSLYGNSRLRKYGLRLLKWSYSQEVFVIHKNEYEISIVDPLVREVTNPCKVAELKAKDPEAFARRTALSDAPWDKRKLEAVDFRKLPGDSESGTFRLTVDQVINYFSVDVGNQEVVYIGKTERKPFDRLLPHEDLQELQASCLRSDSDAIVVHLFKFKAEDTTPKSQKVSTAPPSTLTSTIEAELINYFKPEKNEDYVGDAGKRNWKHIKDLTRSGYSEIRIHMEFEYQYTKFRTSAAHAENPLRHYFTVDLHSLKRRPVPKYGVM